MQAEHLVAFNLALVAAMISPGPALLVAMRAGLTGGRAAGMAVGAGLASMAALWTLAALLGLDAIFAVAPWAFSALKIAGGLFLLWIAVNTWTAAYTPMAAARVSGTRSYLSGVMVNLGNPKSVLFAAAVLVVIFPPDLPIGASLFVTLNHLGLELIFYTFVATAMSSAPVSARYLRMKPVFDRISAVILGGLGLRLLVGR